MNTNQVNQAFEDFYNENKHLYTDTSPYGIMLTTFQAASQASEIEINSLKERVVELEADLELLKPHPKCDMGCMLSCNTEGNAIRELQADNKRLREELETKLTSLQEMKDKYEI